MKKENNLKIIETTTDRSIEQISREKDDKHYLELKKLSGKTDEDINKEIIIILKNKNLSSDQKNALLSTAIFAKGMESASFLAELFLSKGNMTRETREFKSQMRFDFEFFSKDFILLLKKTGKKILKDIFDISNNDLEEIINNYAYENKEINDDDFLELKKLSRNNKENSTEKRLNNIERILLSIAFDFIKEAKTIGENIRAITQERLDRKGFGTYIDKNKKVYKIRE